MLLAFLFAIVISHSLPRTSGLVLNGSSLLDVLPHKCLTLVGTVVDSSGFCVCNTSAGYTLSTDGSTCLLGGVPHDSVAKQIDPPTMDNIRDDPHTRNGGSTIPNCEQTDTDSVSGATICTKCSSGFGPTADKKSCTECQSNCLECTSDGVCTSCNTGFYISPTGKTCLQSCGIYAVITAANACVCTSGKATDEGCVPAYCGTDLDCLSGQFCNASHICDSCDTKCLSCAGTSSNCTSCASRHYLSEGACNTGCQTTSDCPSGYYCHNGGPRGLCIPTVECPTPLEHCTKCKESNHCALCDTSFALVESTATCSPCNSITGCTKCIHDGVALRCTSCTEYLTPTKASVGPRECPRGYYADETTCTCQRCSAAIEGCQGCELAFGNPVCYDCGPGMLFESGTKCGQKACSIAHCDRCYLWAGATELCFICAPGYMLTDAGECVAEDTDTRCNTKGLSLGGTRYCTVCETGYVPVDGICKVTTTSRDVSSCEVQGDGFCTKCQDGHLLLEGGCYNVSRMPGNAICGALDEKNECENSSFISSFYGFDGMFIKDSKVASCPNFCASCTQEGRCDTCQFGYALSKDKASCLSCNVTNIKDCADCICHNGGMELSCTALKSHIPGLSAGSSLAPWKIALIVIAVLLVIGALVGVLCWYFICHRRSKKNDLMFSENASRDSRLSFGRSVLGISGQFTWTNLSPMSVELDKSLKSDIFS
ncbi:High cysteine membrane protein [Giardia muris]|uniref:High cysteine membrane protein n=1 Tax=Giardia muris TaxID=5742 RepID=A0A4Z1SMY8_GIAMU|nr:High cysteine membrane protein [Giardia muris]|eukprot:TNJ26950.1 High cysteine membrane protein [Giardia muris]